MTPARVEAARSLRSVVCEMLTMTWAGRSAMTHKDIAGLCSFVMPCSDTAFPDPEKDGIPPLRLLRAIAITEGK